MKYNNLTPDNKKKVLEIIKNEYFEYFQQIPIDESILQLFKDLNPRIEFMSDPKIVLVDKINIILCAALAHITIGIFKNHKKYKSLLSIMNIYPNYLKLSPMGKYGYLSKKPLKELETILFFFEKVEDFESCYNVKSAIDFKKTG